MAVVSGAFVLVKKGSMLTLWGWLTRGVSPLITGDNLLGLTVLVVQGRIMFSPAPLFPLL